MKREKTSRPMDEKHIPASVLETLTPRRWLLAMLLGVFVGLAVIVPGVSGSTIAIIFGLYTGMLYAIGNILNDFRRCLRFLLPIGVGVVLGFGAGFLLIQRYFEAYMFEIVCLFVGFMIGAIPAITKEIRHRPVTPLRGMLFPVGVLVPLAVSTVSILLSAGAGADTNTFADFSVWRYVFYLPLGAIVSATQIIPGLSATAIMMAFGQFAPLINSLHVDYLLAHPQALGLYAALGIGFVVGLVLISKGFSKLLSRYKVTTFFMISGLSVGSILSMFFNADMWEIYTSWSKGAGLPWTTLIIGVLLLVVGFVPSFLLTRYELRRGETEETTKVD